MLLLEKFESLLSRYSFSEISLPFSFNSKAKSLRSHRNLGGDYIEDPSACLTLMKLDSSVARERLWIEFSSIVCIELNTKRLQRRTTRAKILAS